jgi:hypothetical protein
MMLHFRKRIDPEALEKINLAIIRNGRSLARFCLRILECFGRRAQYGRQLSKYSSLLL